MDVDRQTQRERDIYLRRCSMDPCNQLVNRARPSCPPTSPTGQPCPFRAAAFSRCPPEARSAPCLAIFLPFGCPLPRPRPTQGAPPANWRPSPSAHRAALAPAHRPGCPGRAETPPPAANAPGPVGRRLCTVGGYLGTGRTEGLDRRGHPAKGPGHQSPRALRTPATHRIRITGRHPSGPGPWGPGRLYTDSPTTFG